MKDMGLNIDKTKASKPRAGFIPNPELKLLDQVLEVMRFKHYSLRTETSYREWIRRFILFHGQRHPREMGAVEWNGSCATWRTLGSNVLLPRT